MNINSISVNKYPVSSLFDPATKVVFEIPKYQREYTWGTREWEMLFDDLTENDEGYFLGSIICISTGTDVISSPKFEVVDGQQRLTTLSLFLAALYTSMNEHRDLLDEDQQSDILQLKRKLVIKGTKADIRVIPQTQGNNRDDYKALLSKIGIIDSWPQQSYAGLRRIERAYSYFLKRINSLLEESEDKIAALFGILDKVNSAILVMIGVSNHSDAYTLFESLNNRGTPLTGVDLIKNLLLARLDAKGDADLDYYFSRWKEIIDNLGDDYADQERFFRQNYNAFRKDHNEPFFKGDRQYPLGTIATRSTMLDIYEQIISKDPSKALDQLTKTSAIYAEIILNKTENLTENLHDSYQDLQRAQGAPSYLLILHLAKNKEKLGISNDDLAKISRLLVNFFVRRNLTDTPPTRDLIRLFMNCVETIEQNDYRGESIYDYLRSALIKVSASDEYFEEKLRGPVYLDNSGTTRFILCAMAKRSMTRENAQDLWRKNNNNQYVWTIEHIFPQGPNIPDSWVQMIADGDREKAIEYQSQYVHVFGNLTISGYNSALGNKSFEDKKERKDSNGNYIGYRNGFNLNSDVCDKDKWTIDIIKERTDRMVQDIIQLFAL